MLVEQVRELRAACFRVLRHLVVSEAAAAVIVQGRLEVMIIRCVLAVLHPSFFPHGYPVLTGRPCVR